MFDRQKVGDYGIGILNQRLLLGLGKRLFVGVVGNDF